MSATEANPYIHCMLVPLQQHYLLLPNTTIAEVIPATATCSNFKQVEWQQRQIPFIDLEKLISNSDEVNTASRKLCIVHAIKTDSTFDYYAVPCNGSAQLITVNSSALELVQDSIHSPYLHCQIKIGGKVAIIPNLEQLETFIQLQQS